jgi:predicted DNA-binding transcriptional regulator AlpA
MSTRNAQPMKTTNPEGAVPKILTVAETAHLLKLPVSSIYEKSRRRSANGSTPPLPCRRVGKYLRFLESEVLEWLENLPKNNSRGVGKFAAAVLLGLFFVSGAMAQAPDNNGVAYARLHAARSPESATLSQCRAYTEVWYAEDQKWIDAQEKTDKLIPSPEDSLSVEEIYRRIAQSDACIQTFRAEYSKALRLRPVNTQHALAASDFAGEGFALARYELTLWCEFRSRTDAVIGDHGLWKELLMQGNQ